MANEMTHTEAQKIISQHNHAEMVKHLEAAVGLAMIEAKKKGHAYRADFARVAEQIGNLLSSDGGDCGVTTWKADELGPRT